ncbi:MAG TPA: 2-phosphosulfolactate phosphatase [Ktedonobacterales bacterium]
MSSPSPSPEPRVTVSVAHFFADIDLDPERRAQTAYIVVDVIRATTTLAVMFERGARRVLVARDVEAARRVRDSLPGAIVAGEINAVAPPDFDHGNSPDEWGGLDVSGKEILFSTTNGARALHAAMGGGPVFAGSLRNASAVCAAALEASSRLATPTVGGFITIVCSGRDDRPAEDDSLCAGWLVQTLQREAAEGGLPVALGAGAQQALDLLDAQRTAHAEARNWLYDALAASEPARDVLDVGLGADLAWCAEVDASANVPMVAGEDIARALVVIEEAPPDVSSTALPAVGIG